jgi:hypothetical protein
MKTLYKGSCEGSLLVGFFLHDTVYCIIFYFYMNHQDFKTCSGIRSASHYCTPSTLFFCESVECSSSTGSKLFLKHIDAASV